MNDHYTQLRSNRANGGKGSFNPCLYLLWFIMIHDYLRKYRFLTPNSTGTPKKVKKETFKQLKTRMKKILPHASKKRQRGQKNTSQTFSLFLLHLNFHQSEPTAGNTSLHLRLGTKGVKAIKPASSFMPRSLLLQQAGVQLL